MKKLLSIIAFVLFLTLFVSCSNANDVGYSGGEISGNVNGAEKTDPDESETNPSGVENSDEKEQILKSEITILKTDVKAEIGETVDFDEIFSVKLKDGDTVSKVVEFGYDRGYSWTSDGYRQFDLGGGKTFIPYFLGNYNLDIAVIDEEGKKVAMKRAILTVTPEKQKTAITEYEAKYVSAAPTIDGDIDDVWKTAGRIYTYGHNEYVNQATGYVSALWDEGNLYFLAVVYDNDITEKDMCNLWINEDYSKTGWVEREQTTDNELVTGGTIRTKYPANSSDGAYCLCINPLGRLNYYAGYDMSKASGLDIKYKKLLTADEEEYGYVLEVKIPVQTTGTRYSENDEIGFNVSVDDYVTGNPERVTYCNWINEGAYWSDPGVLQKITLKN
ncbi:MAG: hypothetical protein IJU84_08255 [Clostridia bacterium]|nr:hypothetical protein [Clostridia bacterium]